MPRASASKAAVKDSAPKTFHTALKELRASEKTLWVKNLTDTEVIIRSDPEDVEQFNIRLTSPRQGGHIAILPKAALSKAPFQRLWMQRKVTISDDENMEEELLLAMSGDVERRVVPKAVGWNGEEIEGQVTGSPLDNSIVLDVNDKGEAIQRTCLITGQPVYQTQKEIDAGVPPLADHVKDKAYLFPGTQVYDEKTQTTKWVFPKVSIGL